MLEMYRCDLHEIVERDGMEALSGEEHQTACRARQLQKFMTQPFYSTQFFTERFGQYVSLSETVRGCEGILAGKYDDLPENAFFYVGGVDQVVEKAKKLKA